MHGLVVASALALAALVRADIPDYLKKFNLTAISGIASSVCDNKYVNGSDADTTIDDVVCGSLVPQAVLQYIPQIQFGANSTICKGYACTLRALNCVKPTYRVEGIIVNATGKAESCGEKLGVDIETCKKIGQFVVSVPLQESKRSVAEIEEEAAALAAEPLPKEVTPEFLHTTKLLLREYFPDVARQANNFGLAEDETLATVAARKRDGALDEALKQAQVCNPLINVAVNLIIAQVPGLKNQTVLGVNVTRIFGPCGKICEVALCGLNLICHTVTRVALQTVEAQRAAEGCEKTSCARWSPPINQCVNAAPCTGPNQYAIGQVDASKCLPPKRIYTASQADPNDCCDRCDDPCAQVQCVKPTTCPERKWPLCADVVVDRPSTYACCETCVNTCATENTKYAARQPTNCPPVPDRCPAGQTLGPATPGSCCLVCVEPCVGVTCPPGVNKQSCEATGGTWSQKPRESLITDANAKCSDCCGTCTGGKPVTTAGSQKTDKPASAATLVLSFAMVVVALVAMF